MTAFAYAVDEAIRIHMKCHPGSEVYRATVEWRRCKVALVTVEADHFSVPLGYLVNTEEARR